MVERVWPINESGLKICSTLRVYNLRATYDSIVLHTMSCTKSEDAICAVKLDGVCLLVWSVDTIFFYRQIELELCRNYIKTGAWRRANVLL